MYYVWGIKKLGQHAFRTSFKKLFFREGRGSGILGASNRLYVWICTLYRCVEMNFFLSPTNTAFSYYVYLHDPCICQRIYRTTRTKVEPNQGPMIKRIEWKKNLWHPDWRTNPSMFEFRAYKTHCTRNNLNVVCTCLLWIRIGIT